MSKCKHTYTITYQTVKNGELVRVKWCKVCGHKVYLKFGKPKAGDDKQWTQ